MTDPECICMPPDCARGCEVCAEFGSCVPAALRRDGPTEKDRRRGRYDRSRNGK